MLLNLTFVQSNETLDEMYERKRNKKETKYGFEINAIIRCEFDKRKKNEMNDRCETPK